MENGKKWMYDITAIKFEYSTWNVSSSDADSSFNSAGLTAKESFNNWVEAWILDSPIIETRSNMYGKRKKVGTFAISMENWSWNLFFTSIFPSQVCSLLGFLDPPPGIIVNFEFFGICAIIAGISFLIVVAIRENIKNTYSSVIEIIIYI